MKKGRIIFDTTLLCMSSSFFSLKVLQQTMLKKNLIIVLLKHNWYLQMKKHQQILFQVQKQGLIPYQAA